MLNVFAHTTPASSLSAVHKIFEPFSVQTPADKPYSVLFAISTASSGVLKVKVVSTGPNISSLAIEYEG